MSTTPDGRPPAAAPDAVITRLVLCHVDDVPPGSALEVVIDEYELAVFHLSEGGFHVTDNNCTHGPGLLAEGDLQGRVVECDFHGGRFDVVTGEVVAPPCMEPVRTYPTVVDDGKINIEVE